jgi:glycosyltransferase involved in cell wall biosynthesis
VIIWLLAIVAAAKARSLVREVRSGLVPPPYNLTPERRVSLLTPAYQEEKYIGTLLRSAHNQTYPFYDMVVGNSSSDRTAELARSFGAREVQASYGNIAAARNLAAYHSLGEILVFADADVVLHTQFVERAVAALEEGAALVHPREVVYDSAKWNLLLFPPQVVRPWWNTTRCVAVWRDVYEAVGGYDETCNPMAPMAERCREDLDFGARVAALYGRRSVRVLPWLIGTSARRYKAQGLKGWEEFDIPARARIHWR